MSSTQVSIITNVLPVTPIKSAPLSMAMPASGPTPLPLSACPAAGNSGTSDRAASPPADIASRPLGDTPAKGVKSRHRKNNSLGKRLQKNRLLVKEAKEKGTELPVGKPIYNRAGCALPPELKAATKNSKKAAAATRRKESAASKTLPEKEGAVEKTEDGAAAPVTAKKGKGKSIATDPAAEQKPAEAKSAPSKPAADKPFSPYKVIVKNLAWSTKSDELLSTFSDTGATDAFVIFKKIRPQTKLYMKKNKITPTRSSMGYGFVIFGDEDGVKAGMKLEGKELNGRVLRIIRCKEERVQEGKKAQGEEGAEKA